MTCDCPIVFAEVPEMASQIHRCDCPNAPKLSYIDEHGKPKPLHDLAKCLIIESHLTKIEQAMTEIRKLVHEMAAKASEHQWP